MPTTLKCCTCNGANASCKNCRCARNKTPCTSCYPSRKNKCRNSGNTSVNNEANSVAQSAVVQINNSELTNINVLTSGTTIESIVKDTLSFAGMPLLDRVPKGARNLAASALNTILSNACNSDDLKDWCKLFRFSAICFQKPKRAGKRRRPTLASGVINNIQNFLSDPLVPINNDRPARKTSRPSDSEDAKAKLVAKKLANSDIKGAVRVLASNGSFLPFDSKTYALLEKKHPPRHPNTVFPDRPDADAESLQLVEEQVRKAILSFPGGSASGCDLLRPQYLKDLISKTSGESGSHLLTSITRMCNKMLRGDLPKDVLPIMYGASLIAFSKPNGGIRPIAIGNTLRRLVAKAAAYTLKDTLKAKLFPFQLGVSVSGGAEAIVHSVRSYCKSKMESSDPIALLKIDFENAFNTIRRDTFLKTIRNELPSIYPFLYQCYSDSSFLFFNNRTLPSAEGIQQGDPLGPLCFSLCIQSLVSRLSSELNVWYLDDGTLAGDPETVKADFNSILSEQDSLGLRINVKKCELSILGTDSIRNNMISSSFLDQFPGLSPNAPKRLNLLGAPLFEEGIEKELNARLLTLKLTCSRLEQLDHHDALFLLKHVFFIPKLQYLLRCYPCFDNPIIKDLPSE